MASNTKQTRFRRELKRTRSGSDRKRKIAREGTTPSFPIHTEASHKNAPKDQLPGKK